MKIDPNDPRLTAYALGELADSDRIAFEAELAGDPVARQEVEQIRRAAGILKEKLPAEPCPRLEPEQRLAIHERMAPAEPATGGQFGWLPWLAIAAGLVVSAVILFPTTRAKTVTLARNESPLPVAVSGGSIVKELPDAAIPAKNSSGQALPIATGSTPDDLLAGHAGTLSTYESLAKIKPKSAVVTNAKLVASNDGMLQSSGGIVSESKGTGGDKSGAEILAAGAGSTWVAALSFNKEALELAQNNNNAIRFSGGALHNQTSHDTRGVGELSKQAIDATGFVIINSAGSEVAAGNVLTVNGGVITRGREPVNIGGRAQNSSDGQAATIGNGSRNNNTMTGSGGAGRGGWDERNAPSSLPSRARRLEGSQLLALSDEEVPLSPAVPVTGRGFGSRTGPAKAPGTESYTPVSDNPFSAVIDQPLSTFGLDVDTASYANIRRFILNDQLPPRDAVRIEEMLNYFSYNYPAPHGSDPFALYVEMGECPWNPAHQLALVGLKAKDVTPRQQPPLNLVFLIDISGSMGDPGKLALIKQAFRLLVPQLSARDRVSIVVYADNSRVLLPSTRGDDHAMILLAIDSLNASGSTNGGEGIQSAYREATANFIKDGINRVILCTDGDFNIGITDPNELVRLIEQKAQSGVFLNVFGFGMGNLQDSTMQKLADKGNGQYAYIDDLEEARKVLVDQARATLITVAKDVKLQVEFNPAYVQAYRLIGYEKRVLAARDFNNDRKDAGEIGAGHTVTALYEIVPAGGVSGEPGVDPLKYQPAKNRPAIAVGAEWATVKLRYKEPNADTSQLLTAALKNRQLQWRTASDDFQFAAAVATFGMVLRDSPHKADANLGLALELAEAGRGRDVKGYRSEFIDLVKRAGQRAR